jgi:hypothetical protein
MKKVEKILFPTQITILWLAEMKLIKIRMKFKKKPKVDEFMDLEIVLLSIPLLKTFALYFPLSI